MNSLLTRGAIVLSLAAGGGAALADDMGGRGPFGGPFGAAFGLDFAALDADGDGLVTQEELEATGSARFAAADLDGNGALSAEELVGAIEAARVAAIAAAVAEGVTRADQNADGLLQQDEIASFLPGTGMIINRADTDGDGAVSAAEFAELGDRRGHGPRHGDGPRGWGFGLFGG